MKLSNILRKKEKVETKSPLEGEKMFRICGILHTEIVQTCAIVPLQLRRLREASQQVEVVIAQLPPSMPAETIKEIQEVLAIQVTVVTATLEAIEAQWEKTDAALKDIQRRSDNQELEREALKPHEST